MSIDLVKARRERLRWIILVCLNHARPIGGSDSLVFDVVGQEFPDTSLGEIRVEADYLRDRDLVEIKNEDTAGWQLHLSRYGVDIVEYTVPCHPGIARPPRA